MVSLLFLLLIVAFCAYCSPFEEEKNDNIYGTFMVQRGQHYSNKSTLTWGQNGEKTWNTTIVLPRTAALYNCSESCEDPAWM